MRGFCAFLLQGFAVEFARGDGVEAEVELVFPAELARLLPQPRPDGLPLREILLAASQVARIKARLAQCVVAVLRAGMAFRQIRGVDDGKRPINAAEMERKGSPAVHHGLPVALI